VQVVPQVPQFDASLFRFTSQPSRTVFSTLQLRKPALHAMLH
jgi:hypothetical protein